jgi:acyl carrier protein
MLRRHKRGAYDQALLARIRNVLRVHGCLQRDPVMLSDDEDLYRAGMNAHASTNLMVALEREFDLEFPEQLLAPSLFGNINAIASTLLQLGAVASR